MNIYQSKNVYSKLYQSLHLAFNRMMKEVYVKGGVEEPDYTAHLVLNFATITKYLNSIFGATNIKFDIYSVFCHQRPIIRPFYATRGCELGDVLFVYYLIDDQNSVEYNSLLLQAKIGDRYSKNRFDNEIQLKLYSEWPKFRYQRPCIPFAEVDILPKTSNLGAQFLFIDKSAFSSRRPILGVAKPKQYITYERSFAAEFIDFLSFKSGRKFEKDATSSSDGWTKMIWDLIDLTHSSLFTREKSSLIRKPRQPRAILDDLIQLNFITTQEPTLLPSLMEGINLVIVRGITSEKLKLRSS